MVRKATNPASANDAFIVAMKSLQRSAQTERGLRDKLSARQFNSEVIDAIIEKLKNMELINDQKYSENYISYQNRISPRGARYLKLKLIQKGVDGEIAEQATAGITSEDELELARGLAQKRLALLHRFDPQQRKIKLARFLAGRGFSVSVVDQIIRDI